jgi:hypothetical protein
MLNTLMSSAQDAIDQHISEQWICADSGGSRVLSADSYVLSDVDTLVLEPDPKPRVKGMAYAKLYRNIREGFGCGHGAEYEPWLRLRRKNPSPESNQVVAWLPILNRVAHFFSRGEYHTALLLLWLCVADLREQYPIWPIPHPHPLIGAAGAESLALGFSRGLLSIAKEAGIEHGYEVGTRLLYIATLDLLVTVRVGHTLKLAIFSSKPIDDPDAEVRWRTLERLELERRYGQVISAPYHVSSSALVPILLAGQLEWWLGCATLALTPSLIPLAEPFAEEVMLRSSDSIVEAVCAAADRLKIDLDNGWLLFRHCAWTQAIDIDPSQKILTSYPMRPGGRKLRRNLQESLFGESWL